MYLILFSTNGITGINVPHTKYDLINKQVIIATRISYLKMISSPYCAVSGFVFVFVLNLLICYTSVIAYMKFLSPPLRVVTFTNAR